MGYSKVGALAMTELVWCCKAFKELTTPELYEIFRVRLEVFAVEQEIAYQDADGIDQQALHLMAWDSDTPDVQCAYARIIPPGVKYPEASFGRVLVGRSLRNSGLGKELVKRTLQQIETCWGAVPVRISAQLYLQHFYAEFGFEPITEPYMEEGILHIAMRRA